MVTLILPFALLWWGLFRRGFGWRQAFLLSATAWGTLLLMITESLSLGNGLTLIGLRLAWWSIAAGIAAVVFFYLKPVARPRTSASFPLEPSLALLIPIVLILATLAVVGWVAPPNNYDSMTYHMARVVHWMQNHSVAHYPTHIERQLHQSPGAEFIILHLQILTHGDRFANLVQWFAMAGSLIGVSFIAAQFGATLRGQVFATAFCCGIPMGVLQAINTQNDYVLAFWLVCLVSFILSANEEKIAGLLWLYCLAAGAALGLAVVTKGTAYCFAPPLVVWFALSQFRRIRLAMVWSFGCAMVFALLLNAGHFIRNSEIYGSPLGSGRGAAGASWKYANDVHGPRVAASNLVRNTLTELAIPIEPVCLAIEAAGRWVHRVLDIDPDDSRTTMTGNFFCVPGNQWNDENFAANPLHTVLIALTLPALAFVGWPEKRRLLAYAAALVAGFVLLCWLLRYQFWCNRLHLPLIVLWSPVVALAMDRICGRWMLQIVAWIQLGLVVPVIVTNIQHPLRGPANIFTSSRESQYFARGTDELHPFFVRFAKEIRQGNCSRVGLVLGWNTMEYPLWILLWQDNPDIRIEHINVANPSARASGGTGARSFTPEAVLAVDMEKGYGETKILKSTTQPAQ